MKLSFFVVLCFLALFSFISCQKEVSFEVPDGTTANAVNTVDSNYLDRILIVDSTTPNFVDSSFLVFNYDSQKRISNLVVKSTTNPLDSQLYAKFFYNANDTLPFKSKTFTDSADYYFYYDNVGRLKKDSIINFGSQGSNNPSPTLSVNNYSYGTNKIFKNGYFIDPNSSSPNPFFKLDTLFQDVRGNIINAKIYSSNTTSNYTLEKTIVSTFDNNINPYAKVPGFKVFLLSFGDFTGFITTNNLLSAIIYYNSQPSFVYTENYSNSYYPNGFLKKGIILTGNTLSNWTYFYKSL